MLIYNSKEYDPVYLREDTGRIIEIHSIYGPEELFTRLKAGEDLSDDSVRVISYETPVVPEVMNNPYREIPDTRVLDEDDVDDIRAAIPGDRQKLFMAYEALQFNNPWETTDFQPHECTKEEVVAEIADAIGIMPALRDIPELSVTELQKMSSAGNRLFRPYARITLSNNRLPSRAEIEFYQSLNDYEQRLINESSAHPMKILTEFMRYKEQVPEGVLTVDFVKRIETGRSSGYIYLDSFFETENEKEKRIHEFAHANLSFNEDLLAETSLGDGVPRAFLHAFLNEYTVPEIYLPGPGDRYVKDYIIPEWNKFKSEHEEYREEDFIEFAHKEYKAPVRKEVRECAAVFEGEKFKNKHHGRSPRILDLYMEGYRIINRVSDWKPEHYDDIADKFDLKNVQKIAKMKNVVLFAMAPYVRFAEMNEKHMQIFASEVFLDDLPKLKNKGFFEWYAAHKDTKPSELSELLTYVTDRRQYENRYAVRTGSIERFNVNKSAKELIKEISERKGRGDCAEMEGKYDYHFSDNETAIKGRHIVVKDGGLTMYMLSPEDYRNFTIGYDTDCCQHLGNAGESCVWKYTSDPFAAAVVIEKNGKILAQAFVWTDEEKDTFVFDNMEFANDAKIGNYANIITAYVKAIPYSNVHIGVGYLEGGMSGWGKKITYEAKMPSTLGRGTHVYTDYHFNGGDAHIARSLKKNGRMQIPDRGYVKIETAPDEPTRWDALRHPALAFLINGSGSIEEKIELANSFLHEQTPEVQDKIVRINPAAIKYIDDPTPDVQRYVISRGTNYASFIKNPCAEVQEVLMQADPKYIKNINNPTEDMQLRAVRYDGLLLQYIKDPSEQVITEAVKQNGYALNCISKDKWTDPVVLEAVKQNPKVIGVIRNPSEDMVMTALRKNPHTIALLPADYAGFQIAAVQMDPSVILDIRNPIRPAVEAAIRENGLLIRNFQGRYPEFRMMAVEQNGFALQALRNPTVEECIAAVKTTPDAISVIKDPDMKAMVMDAVHESEAERDL